MRVSHSAQVREKLFTATVIPGYDDTVVRKFGFRRRREDGKYYEKIWKIALESSPDWILITSFNEWHEGSEIEPSKEYGDKYLKITAKFADIFKNGSCQRK